MKLAALQTLIAAGESLALELKKSTAEKDRACRSLCALANGDGGQVRLEIISPGELHFGLTGKLIRIGPAKGGHWQVRQ